MRLLVVDDDNAILKLISRVLRDDSYALDLASTGEEARMLALVNEYDGIILDLQLGDRHGFEILQELRRNGRRTPVLLYSGLGDTESIVRGLDAGADDYVVKPVSNEELRARVRTRVRAGERGQSDLESSDAASHLRQGGGQLDVHGAEAARAPDAADGRDGLAKRAPRQSLGHALRSQLQRHRCPCGPASEEAGQGRGV